MFILKLIVTNYEMFNIIVHVFTRIIIIKYRKFLYFIENIRSQISTFGP